MIETKEHKQLMRNSNIKLTIIKKELDFHKQEIEILLNKLNTL